MFKLTRNGGENDESYRSRIKSFASSFVGGGVKSYIKYLIQLNLNLSDEDIKITIIDANKILVKVDTDDANQQYLIRQIVNQSKAVGVKSFFVFKTQEFNEGVLIRDDITISDGNTYAKFGVSDYRGRDETI